MTNKDSKNINKTWKIYKHTLILKDCHEFGWSYIGQTSAFDPESRWGSNGANYPLEGQSLFASAIKKYGWENFTHEILEDNIQTLQEANLREQYWISFYHTWTGDSLCQGWNRMRGGGNNWYIASEETRAKMSAAKIGISHTDVYNAALSKKTGHGEVICIETGTVYYSLGDAFRKTGIRHIPECCYHKQSGAGGYHWAFMDDQAWYNKYSDFAGKEKREFTSTPLAIFCIELNRTFTSHAAASDFIKTENPKLSSKDYRANLARAIKTHGRCGGYHWANADDILTIADLQKLYLNKIQKTEVKQKGKCRALICTDLNLQYNSIAEAAYQLNLSAAQISGCLRGKSKTAGGHTFSYL